MMFLKKIINFSLFLALGFCAQCIQGAAAAAAVVGSKFDISQVEIRKFKVEDFVEIAQARELFINAFSNAFSKDLSITEFLFDKESHGRMFDNACARLAIKNYFSYVVIFNEEVVGIVFGQIIIPHELSVDWLATDPSYFRCGIGRRLIDFLKDYFTDVKEITLLVTEKNAKSFYRKLGFQDRDADDQNKEDYGNMILMTKKQGE